MGLAEGSGGGGVVFTVVTTSRRLYLFKLKYVLIEVVLKPLVGKVDAELFKAVVLIVFKSKDIKDTNGQDLVLKKKTRKRERKYYKY